MWKKSQVIGLVLLLLVVACGGCSRRQIYQSAYEGLKARQRLTDPADDGRPAEEDVSYDRYERERREILE